MTAFFSRNVFHSVLVHFCRQEERCFCERGWDGAQVLCKVSVGVSSKTFRLGTMLAVVLLDAVRGWVDTG